MAPAPASDPSSQVDTPMTDANDLPVPSVPVDGAVDAPMMVSDADSSFAVCRIYHIDIRCKMTRIELLRTMC